VSSAAGDHDLMSSDSELQTMSRIPRALPRRLVQGRRRLADDDDDDEDSSEALRDVEPAAAAASRPLLYQAPDTRVCYFYRDGDSSAAPVKLVVSRRAYPTVDVLKDELTRRVDGLPFGVRGIYTPAGRDVVRSLSDLRPDGRYVCTTVAARARGVDVRRADAATGGQVWRSGVRPDADRQRELNAVIRGDDDRSPRADMRLAWATSDSEQSGKSLAAAAASAQLTPRSSPKKIVVVCDGDVVQKQTLLLYRRTSQTFEQVLSDLSGMFREPVRNMFTVDGVQVS